MHEDLAPTSTVKPLVVPEIVTLPEEIDITNAERVGAGLRSALQPGVTVVIADMGLTKFIDSSGVRILLTVQDAAAASHAELRVVIPAVQVLRALSVMGIDRELSIYPSLGMALTAGPPPELSQPADRASG